MTTYKGFSPKTSELAPANNSVIAVQAEDITPLALTADAQGAIATFTACPGIAATGNAFSKAKDGIVLMWEREQKSSTVKNFFIFLWDAGKAIVWPLILLLWSAMNAVHVWRQKPDTKKAAAEKWQAVKGWFEPKFAYETEADRNSELEL